MFKPQSKTVRHFLYIPWAKGGGVGQNEERNIGYHAFGNRLRNQLHRVVIHKDTLSPMYKYEDKHKWAEFVY